MSTNREGNIYEVLDGIRFDKGSIVIMKTDDTTDMPYFDVVKGAILDDDNNPKGHMCAMRRLKQLYPPLPEEPIEIISLMGKEYSKVEIEAALQNIKSI